MQKSTKEFYIKNLKLNSNIENGFLKGIYPEVPTIPSSSVGTKGDRGLYSFSFYLLSYPYVNPLHQLLGDESWQYCDGYPLLLHTIDKDGNYSNRILGDNPNKGESFVYIVPRFTWMCAEVLGKNDESFTLISHFSLPSFHIDDHIPGKYDELKENFPQHEYLIKRFHWKD